MSGPKLLELSQLTTKDPDSSEIHQLNWDSFLPTGVTITVSAWAFTLWRYSGDAIADATALAALTKSSEAIDPTTARKTQYMAIGGTLGAEYTVTNHITCSDGEVFDGSYRILSQQT